MTKAEVIGRLEMLLERVRARIAEPHRQVATGGNAETGRPLVAGGDAEVIAEATDTRGGEETFAPERAPDGRTSYGNDSSERLVAAQSPASLQAAAESGPDVIESPVPIDMTDADVVAEDEEPPSSSRRTVAAQPEERLDQMAFGAEEPDPRGPLHTPPPESGRLPAAASTHFDADDIGVRSATPLLPRRPPAPPPDLVPDEIRPARTQTDAVADVIAEAQRFAPTTFVALLDASLSL
ncbi:MAG: hypothetical protein M3O46_11890 [Myxococcota bacterium]|nr:hypothetical protein [Myxococcota bacterium]